MVKANGEEGARTALAAAEENVAKKYARNLGALADARNDTNVDSDSAGGAGWQLLPPDLLGISRG